MKLNGGVGLSMEIENSKKHYDLHFFVCGQEKQGKECCGKKGGAWVCDQIKASLKQKLQHLPIKVRVSHSGCMGRCEEGIVCVSYPDQKWFTQIKATEEDVGRILQEILNETAKKCSP